MADNTGHKRIWKFMRSMYLAFVLYVLFSLWLYIGLAAKLVEHQTRLNTEESCVIWTNENGR